MPSILFVHGAGHAAWCWHEHFTPWFEARGYTVAAPDLPCHGGLDRAGLKTAPLSAYVGAVAHAAAGLPPPVPLWVRSQVTVVPAQWPVRGSASLSVAQNEARPSLADSASVMRSAGAFTLTARAIGAAMVRVLLG